MTMSEPTGPVKRWTIRGARIEDAAEVERFLVSVPEYSETLVANEQREVWRWLYARDGGEVKDVLVAQDAGDSIVAHYGLAQLRYDLAGRKVNAGIACLLAIQEQFRKTHMFIELTRRLLKEFRESGGSFVTGLANRAGLLEFHKAFGFVDIGEVSIFVKPVRPAQIARKLLPLYYTPLSPLLVAAEAGWGVLLRLMAKTSSRSVRLEPITAFDSSIAATSAEIAKHHKYFAERGDASVLNRRFFGLSCRDYSVFRIARGDATIGYVALRSMDMKGFNALGIVDICFDLSNRPVARAVLRAIDRIALERGADLVSMLTNSAPLIARLKWNFYLRAPETFRLVILEPSKALALGASRIDDWYVTWFEHDYV
ncbi:MAG: hypothetical protein JWR80_7372 [Bradyrhizobium sp.]|nr:hypothetical protein [Bradyrhizobium sp.]